MNILSLWPLVVASRSPFFQSQTTMQWSLSRPTEASILPSPEVSRRKREGNEGERHTQRERGTMKWTNREKNVGGERGREEREREEQRQKM